MKKTKFKLTLGLIIVIGGIWLSQNMWVLERKISTEDYPKNIVGVWQNLDANDYTRQNIMEFYSDGSYEIRNEKNGVRSLRTGKYIINGKTLTIMYDDPFDIGLPSIDFGDGYIDNEVITDKTKEEFLFFTKNYIKLKTVESRHPRPWGVEVFKRYK